MATAAQAQPAAAAAGVPLPVVCIAADAAALQPLAERRQRPLLAAGGRQVLQVGVGFVVDRERQHVLTAWHTATACPEAAGVGIVETVGGERFVTAAQRLPDRNYQDASGRPVKLVQAVCRDAARPCGADLPRGAGEAPPGEALRRQQRDNVRSYAPDLAVLRLLAPARSAPLGLAVADQLDDQVRVQIRGASLTAPAPVFDAVYTGPQQISWLPEGGQPEDRIHARVHRLAATLPAGLAGSPVLRGSGVVGLLSALDDAADGSGTPQVAAVPATVMAAFLVLLKVPYVAAVADPLRPAVSSLPPPVLPSERPWTADPQRLMLAGAAALAVLAAVAFALLARRNARRPLPAPSSSNPPSTPTQRSSAGRVNPTLLHAVAAPTAALASQPQGPQAHLHGSHGPLGGSLFSLPMPNGGSLLYVGRDPQSCQVVFPAAAHEVSAVHASFDWQPASGRLSLSDLSSSGTWVNGQRLVHGQARRLNDGDRVDLGAPDSNRFTVELPALPSEAPR